MEYWVIRNSFGRYFGDDGYFNLKLGSNILGIESDCSYGVPKFLPFEKKA